MSEWTQVRLGSGLRVHHGFAFKGEFFSPEGKQIVLTPGNFVETGGFKPKSGTEKYYLGPVPEKFLLRKGDVVIAMTEQAQGLLGSSATIPEDGVYLHNQRIGLLEITDPELLHLRFVYHLMNSTAVRRQVQATATGSKVRHTAPERVHAVTALVPSPAEQRAVAEILDAIDDLIENNRRRIQVLEEMARAIYREWFVKFRYPGHESGRLVDSALGPIPEGWVVASLSSVASVTMGQSPKSEFYNDQGIGKSFHQGVSDFGSHYPRTRKWCSAEGRSAAKGDILISVRAPVGRINIADTDITIGRGLSAVRAKDGRQALLLGGIREAFVEEDSMGNDGAIFKSLGKAELAAVPVIVGSADVADQADRLLSDNLELIRTLSDAAEQLVAMRDLLLHKVVTGQIDVSALDLHRVLDEAVA